MPNDSQFDIETCFRTYGPRVYRWAYGLCRHPADAADVTQEVFARLVRRGPRFSTGAEAIAWLRRVTNHAVVDRWRATASNRTRALPADLPAVEDRRLDEETRQSVRQALLRLSDQQRLVVLARIFDGLTFRETAAELGISIPTAKTHYLRAIVALRDQLQRLRPLELES